MAAIPDWSEEKALEIMEHLNIASALLSISSPGVHFGDDRAAQTLARQVNEEGARLRDAHPDRFGWFAVTPLPDVQSAVTEALFALDVLRADGIIVESNHHGLYLGDARMDPFYAALNEREAVMFIHPTSPSCTGCGSLALGYPMPMLEFMFETTRTVMQLILSGATKRFPKIRIIVPHAGAALPVLVSRVDLMISLLEAKAPDTSPSMRAELRKLYYDLAGAPLPELLNALFQVADPDHIFYGSDWPFTPATACRRLVDKLDTQICQGDELLNRLMNGNARKLFPRFA
jgi:predicted TIM-barrel fold metal-dependent hydrolase